MYSAIIARLFPEEDDMANVSLQTGRGLGRPSAFVEKIEKKAGTGAIKLVHNLGQLLVVAVGDTEVVTNQSGELLERDEYCGFMPTGFKLPKLSL